MIYLDTHVVIWLSEGKPEKLSLRGRRLLDSSPIRISPFVELELQFIYELGRLRQDPAIFLPDLYRRLEAERCSVAAGTIIDNTKKLAWTRDPMDRLIVANAMVQKAKLLTKDDVIREHYTQAIW